ncbi:MAG: sulfotransferase [Erythrobacter sp.]
MPDPAEGGRAASELKRQAGSLDEALANGRRLLAVDPAAALAQAQAILRAERGNAPALRLAAAAHRARGETNMAERAELAAIAASERDPALQAIGAALASGEFGEASRLAALRLRAVPDDLAALTMSAESAIALGVADKADGLLDTVLQRAPGFVPAQMLRISALIQMDRLAEARAALEQQIERHPGRIDQYRMLSRILAEAGQHAEAAKVSARLVELPDALVEDLVNHADGLRFAGDRTAAIAAYRTALARDPLHGRGWWSLADMDVRQLSSGDVAAMEAALAQRAGEPEHAGNLHFALGIAHDAQQNFAAAFEHFRAGNAMRRAAQPYDAQELSQQVDRWIAEFPSARPLNTARPGHGDPVPVFILGMPRAGSTLLERVLGMHSAIEPMGELTLIANIVRRLGREQAAEELERRVAELSANELDAVRARYFARVQERRPSTSPYFVDKLHMNWKHLPLILRALPHAKVIDLRRDPLDCCWSNYKTLFARGHPAASDLADLGRFYRDYVRLTDHFRSLAPDKVMLVDYQELVGSFEPTIRAVLEFLGLPFEPACLEFHRSEAPVATASSEQVRKPLNREGVGIWRNYEPWLGPLKEALGEAGNGRL